MGPSVTAGGSAKSMRSIGTADQLPWGAAMLKPRTPTELGRKRRRRRVRFWVRVAAVAKDNGQFILARDWA